MPATDLTSLTNSHDIISIGMLADEVRRRLHGTRTTFVRVATVSADVGAPVAHAAAAGELRIVGAPESGSAAIARVREVAAAAGGVVVTGFSLQDLERLSVQEGVTLRALLEELRAAGLELVADAAVDALQDARRSIEEVNIAGLALARLTVDRAESPDPTPLLKAVSELQRAVAVLRAFAPLPRRVNPAAPTTGFDDVKRVALARLVVDNVPSIQVDWSLYGPKLAQVALTVGADDVDAVSPEDSTTEGRRRAPLEEIRRNIRAAGLEPAERNGRFDVLTR
jgi:aminodeoxyfutalosine synthase